MKRCRITLTFDASYHSVEDATSVMQQLYNAARINYFGGVHSNAANGAVKEATVKDITPEDAQ